MSQKTKQELYASLPMTVVPRLEEMEKALVTALEAELKALIVFGSAVRGDYRPGYTDIEILLVLKSVRLEQLGAIASPLAMARYAIRAEPMMETADVAEAVLTMASLPLSANILHMTVMATNMPLVGRG